MAHPPRAANVNGMTALWLAAMVKTPAWWASWWCGAAGVGAAAVAVLGLTSDGRVRAAGDDTCGQCDVAAWTDIVAIAAGSRHTVGIRPDGTAIAAGCNDDGQCDVGTWAGLRPG